MLPEFPFVGRSPELEQLLGLWREVCNPGNGPKLVTILGEPGYGKTRLIREFYSKIASESHGKDRYWPSSLPQSANRMDINPQFGGGTGDAEMPWLWWGIRCEPNETRNGAQDEGCAFIRSSAHLMQHTGALEKKRDRTEKIGRLKAASIAQLLKLAEEIPVLGTAIRHYSSGSEWLELYRSAVEAARPSAAPSAGVKMQLDVQSACEACLKICQAFIDPTDGNLPTIPMVLVIDDAHAADPLTIKCAYQILHFAHSRSLPLLVIATNWAKEWKLADSDPPPNLSMTESWKSFRQIASALPMRLETQTKPVFHEVECEAMDCRLILDGLELSLGDRLEKHCLDFADGNPQMLRELLSFLHEYRKHRAKDWWFKNPSPDMQLSERGFEEFAHSTRSKEEFLKHRAEEVQKDPHLSMLLQLGALHGHSFLSRFTAEVWSELGDARSARPGSFDLLRSGETPHHVIRLSGTEEQFARFRHRSYRDAFLAIDPTKRQALLDAISAKTISWLESTPEDPSNTDFFRFAVNWFREKNDPEHLEGALAIRASHLIQFGRPSQAAELLEERLSLLVASHGQESPEANLAEMEFAKALVEAGRFQESIQILESLRQAFSEQSELWVDCSRSLAWALQKKSEADGVPTQSFSTWISGKRSITPERNQAAEILKEVWSHLRERLDSGSLDVLLAGLEYANAITEGAHDADLAADQGLIIFPCSALILQNFGDNDPAKDTALKVLGQYLDAWRWPKTMNVSRRSTLVDAVSFYHQNLVMVAELKEVYPEAKDVFRDLLLHRKEILGERHPSTIEAKRLELLSWNPLRWEPAFQNLMTQLNELVAASKSILGDHHLQTLECEVALAGYLQGGFEAATLLQQVLERARINLGTAHPWTLNIQEKVRRIIPNS